MNLKMNQNFEQYMHLVQLTEYNRNSHIVVDGCLATFLQFVWIE